MRARLHDLSVSRDGGWLLTIRTNENVSSLFDELHDSDVDITVKKFRKKRSLDASAYFWVLANRLAEKLRIDANGIYRSYVPDIGGSYEVVPVREDKIDAWEKVWCSGHIGRMIEDMGPCRNIKGYHNIRSYISSSDYDTAQMSQLIEMVVADCKEQGIETMTPRELDALVSRWGEVSL